ncbi:hypothetical protein G6F46_011175 [Rhizopus delemar]|uniref:Uncharacterized protein n=2 Tax=Rhizopus TaxID=4842 RepID=A0A9P6YUM0_9FUNG|nr:hypothetical protein G6F55_010944 [Rhizopus delemar]KAG1543672.1 hypothetical protein G6F51_006533 [Rhizopus arrhizus]KAG1489092.1 hypothetical protein G6F54_011683 [Rhizopus delemar]KAG1496734.1 hypothetical protein G6F53_012117 [Rhizopus delemar]KAG1510876.1 hypothetical protein G6F52_010793 [Rhizopus delemar]
MQSVITSTFAGVFFPHSMEFDHANGRVYFMLYEPYMANYSVKVIASLDLVQEMIHGYDNEWAISRINEKKSPLILLATGAMKQQPTIRASLGRVVEEKFHIQALAMTIIAGISLVPERLREMIHPEVEPIQLGDGAKEGYFYVNLSMNQDFSNGPEFYENTATREELDEYERQILEENQRRNQEARGDNVEIPDSTENNEARSYNPYYTDEDEPYIPPEYPSYVRRMSDSSSDANTEKHYDQHEGGLPEDMLRCAHEDLNRMDDQRRREDRNNKIFSPHINASNFDDEESSGSEKTIMQSMRQTATTSVTSIKATPSNRNITRELGHASGNYDTVRCPNATSMITDNDPMEGSCKSAIMHHQHNRSHSIRSDVSVADSETSLTTGFRNLLNPFLNENINGE